MLTIAPVPSDAPILVMILLLSALPPSVYLPNFLRAALPSNFVRMLLLLFSQRSLTGFAMHVHWNDTYIRLPAVYLSGTSLLCSYPLPSPSYDGASPVGQSITYLCQHGEML